MEEADFSGKRGETLAVPTQGELGAKAVGLVGVGEAGRADDRSAAHPPRPCCRRAGREGGEGRDQLDDAPAEVDTVVAAQALAEGCACSVVPVPHVPVGDAPAVEAEAVLVGAVDATPR